MLGFKISSKRCKVINIIRNFVPENEKKHEISFIYICVNAWHVVALCCLFYSRTLQLRMKLRHRVGEYFTSCLNKNKELEINKHIFQPLIKLEKWQQKLVLTVLAVSVVLFSAQLRLATTSRL